MNTYDALLSEIDAMESARDSLPSDVPVRALFDLVIMRLADYAEASRVYRNDLDRDRTSFQADMAASNSFGPGILSDLSFSRRNDNMIGPRA
jgi:hypothetical protein